MAERDNRENCMQEPDAQVPRINNKDKDDDEDCVKLDNIDAICVIDEDPYWLVEEIKDVRVDQKGKLMYLVKWVGYSDDINSWEPEENCTLARRCIAEFHQRMSESKRNMLAQQLLAQSKAASDTNKSKSRKTAVRRPKRTVNTKKKGHTGEEDMADPAV